MIIIEGPDGAGKTTLVKQLQEEYGFDVGERGTEDRTKLYLYTVRDTHKAVRGAVNPYAPPLIWDRLFYSELVYYPYTTGKCRFNQEQINYFTRMIDALRCPVVLCLPPEHLVVESVEDPDRQEMDGVKENIRTIYHGYEQLYRDLIFPDHTFWYDYTRDAFTQLKQYIDPYLTERQERNRT